MGDDKDVIKEGHTLQIYQNLQKAWLCIFPGGTHMIPETDPELFNGTVEKFFSKAYYRPDTKVLFGVKDWVVRWSVRIPDHGGKAFRWWGMYQPRKQKNRRQVADHGKLSTSNLSINAALFILFVRGLANGIIIYLLILCK